VIGNRYPFVVLRKRILRRQQGTSGAGMMNARVEIRVVRYCGRAVKRAFCEWNKRTRSLPSRLVATGALIEQPGHRTAHVSDRWASTREERVERGLVVDVARDMLRQQPRSANFLEIEDAIADGHTDPRCRIGTGTENPEGQVLNRKVCVRIVCRVDETAARGVVSLVEMAEMTHVTCRHLGRYQAGPQSAPSLNADFGEEGQKPLVERLCHCIDFGILELSEHGGGLVIFHRRAPLFVLVNDDP
jgi:hypothetical protein